MTYSDFENIVMQDMPKIIFSLFLACAYFSLESNACIAHVERMMPQDPTRDNILCSALPAEECTNVRQSEGRSGATGKMLHRLLTQRPTFDSSLHSSPLASRFAHRRTLTVTWDTKSARTSSKPT